MFHGIFIRTWIVLGIVDRASPGRRPAAGAARPGSFDELRTQADRRPRRPRRAGSAASIPPKCCRWSRAEQPADDREQRVTRALTKAGDLAHGLKTPLTLLNQQAERAKAEGQTALAAAIMQQVERMRRQVDYHLAHARASASGGNPDGALPRADVGRRAGAHDDDDPRRSPPRDRRARVARAFRPRQREDFEEMLGNLVDNACKWAKTRVEVRSALDDGSRRHDGGR